MLKNQAERGHNPIFISHFFRCILYSQRQFSPGTMDCWIWLVVLEKNTWASFVVTGRIWYRTNKKCRGCYVRLRSSVLAADPRCEPFILHIFQSGRFSWRKSTLRTTEYGCLLRIVSNYRKVPGTCDRGCEWSSRILTNIPPRCWYLIVFLEILWLAWHPRSLSMRLFFWNVIEPGVFSPR